MKFQIRLEKKTKKNYAKQGKEAEKNRRAVKCVNLTNQKKDGRGAWEKNCEIAGLKFQILQQGKNKFEQKNIVNLTQNLTYIFKKIKFISLVILRIFLATGVKPS